MYVRFEEYLDAASCLDYWLAKVGRFGKIAGYTSFGDIFLVDPKTGDIGMLSPLKNDFVEMGYGDWDEFEREVLTNEQFVRRVLRSEDLGVLKERLGDLGEEEVFIPEPYPFIGGTGALETYAKGKVWTFVELVGQAEQPGT